MQKKLVILINLTVIFSQLLFLFPAVEFGLIAKACYMTFHLFVAIVLVYVVLKMIFFQSGNDDDLDEYLLCLHRCSFVSFVNVLFLFIYGLLIIQYTVKDSVITSNSLRVALSCCQMLSMAIYMKSLQFQRFYLARDRELASWLPFPNLVEEPLPIYRSKDEEDLPNYSSQIASLDRL
jgi:hypothetical protein